MEETRLAQAIAEGLSPYSIAEQLAALTTGYTPDLQGEQQEPTYYDRPVLKASLWRWESIGYFFLVGLAVGCCLLATVGCRTCQRHYGDHSSSQRWPAGAMVGSEAAGRAAAKIDRAPRNRAGHVPGWLYRGAAGSYQYSPVVAQQAAGGRLYLFCDIYQLSPDIFAPAPQQCTNADPAQAGAP